jgi:hypothetical protein
MCSKYCENFPNNFENMTKCFENFFENTLVVATPQPATWPATGTASQQ